MSMADRAGEGCSPKKLTHTTDNSMQISHLTSQTHFRSKKSGELRIQAVFHCTVQYGPITLQYFVT